eukprot:gene7026-11191_t
MFSFIQAILAKKEWSKKLQDKKIREKWTKEVRIQLFEISMIEYMLERLKYEMKETKNLGTIVSPFHSIFQSDNIIEKNLKEKFIKESKELEKLPKDFHPFSNEQVIDLVHPSLYCLISKKTSITKDKMKQRDIPMFLWLKKSSSISFPLHFPDFDEYEEKHDYCPEVDFDALIKPNFVSKKFQWLPSDITVFKNGKVQFESYINNLHPVKYKSLYGSLEKILEKFIPMFEMVLGYPNDHIIDNKLHIDIYDELESQNYKTRKHKLFNKNFEPKKIPKYNLHGRDLQVIVKMANIELTPENPIYPGGSWHMEGMENERIVATGIYYYDQLNISESRLAFRQAVIQPESRGQDYGRIFGLWNQSKLNQQIGSITALEDRCIAFPNYYQHAVQPFELENKKKVGHRKILVFFLIDPKFEIISTRRVFPQQKDWILNSFEILFQNILPKEVIEIIISFSSDSMTFEQAEKVRLEFMDERKESVKEQDGTIFNRMCSLCEH